MPASFLGTPYTNDVSSVTDDLNQIVGLSPEKSFAAPADKERDLLSQMRDARGTGLHLKTPGGGRDPLRLLPNGNQRRPEFTPMMRSATKTNISKRLSARRRSGHATTPGLPTMDESNIRSEQTNSFIGDRTPMTQHLSSSPNGTPLAQLPGQGAGGVVNDGNMMTLREQENIIDKIEKENFGLKMKIHFLEEALSKRGSEFNQAALKENTDLKVNRITMQRELHKFKKTVAQAERDAELYRQHLEEYRERVRRKQVDESFRVDMENLKTELKSRDSKIEDLQSKYDSVRSKGDDELERLRDEVGDLQAELRERDRQVEERDDQIDALKRDANKESHVAAELEDELNSAKQQVSQLKKELEKAARDAEAAQAEREDAEMEQRRAEQDLDELRDEMANKSFTTKGLSRQLEEKTHRLEDEFNELQEKYEAAEAEIEKKSASEKRLQERLRDVEKEGSSGLRHLQQDLETVQQQRDTYERKLNGMMKQAESFEKELQIKKDEKDLLQTRHDALTIESAQLQSEMSKIQRTVGNLEATVDEERQRSAMSENMLKAQQKTELDHQNEQVDSLHREINSKVSQHTADRDDWESEKRALGVSLRKAEEKASGLERTILKLQDVQGTLSGKEMKVQEALASEKERHVQEENILNRQIEELNQDLISRRTAADANRAELNNAKEELRISIRDQATLREKVAELEDEIEVLQADIEQEHELAQQIQQKSTSASDGQLAKLRNEKSDLQQAVVDLRVELDSAKKTIEGVEADRADLDAKLENLRKSNDDTFDMQQEKREFRREKQKLEKDLERLASERDLLLKSNTQLQEELDAEIEHANEEENRLNDELDKLRHKQLTSHDSRDKELASAKSKVARLEARIVDLENLMENQSVRPQSPSVDASGLRRDLEDARKNETAIAKREAELKTANRDMRMRLNDLERELHQARLAQLKSPSASPPASHSKELTRMREEVVNVRADLKRLQSENRKLSRAAERASPTENKLQQLDSDTLLRLGAEETTTLAARLSSQEGTVKDLHGRLEKIRRERDEAREELRITETHRTRIDALQADLRRVRAERDAARRLSPQASQTLPQQQRQDKEAAGLKIQLQRLREERGLANKKAEAVEKELEMLQARYEAMLERLTGTTDTGRDGKDTNANVVHEKEMKGLVKEVIWLKAKCRREERMRRDLAWSKTYLEQNEAMRVHCNQIDLRILREMGVELDPQRYERRAALRPVQKFRAGVLAVMAAIRMSNLEEQWREMKVIGEELKETRHRQTHQQRQKRLR